MKLCFPWFAIGNTTLAIHLFTVAGTLANWISYA